MKYITTFLLAFLVSNTGYAEVPTLTEEQSLFIEDYIEAAEEEDGDLYWDLIHPESRECMSGSFKEFVQQNFLQKTDEISRLDIDNIRIEEANMPTLEKQVAFFYRDKAFLSVEPNYMFKSEVTTEAPDSGVCSLKSSTYMFSIPVAFYQGAWYEVMPCGRDDLETFMAKQIAARAAQKKRIDDIYNSVSLDEWSALNPALSEERNVIKAIKMLRESKGLSLSESKAVIDIRCENLADDKG